GRSPREAVPLRSPEVSKDAHSARLSSLRPPRALLRFGQPACRRVEGFLPPASVPASRLGFREKKGRLVPATDSALRRSLAASPLPPAGSPLAGFSAVFACRANASVSSLPSVRPFRFPSVPYSRTMPLLTPADSAQPPGCG